MFYSVLEAERQVAGDHPGEGVARSPPRRAGQVGGGAPRGLVEGELRLYRLLGGVEVVQWPRRLPSETLHPLGVASRLGAEQVLAAGRGSQFRVEDLLGFASWFGAEDASGCRLLFLAVLRGLRFETEHALDILTRVLKFLRWEGRDAGIAGRHGGDTGIAGRQVGDAGAIGNQGRVNGRGRNDGVGRGHHVLHNVSCRRGFERGVRVLEADLVSELLRRG